MLFGSWDLVRGAVNRDVGDHREGLIRDHHVGLEEGAWVVTQLVEGGHVDVHLVVRDLDDGLVFPAEGVLDMSCGLRTAVIIFIIGVLLEDSVQSGRRQDGASAVCLAPPANAHVYLSMTNVAAPVR